jgi:Cdc6-like AAA superfamily ATPase
MATPEDVLRLRGLTSYTEVEPYDDPQLSDLIDATSIYRVASRIWNEKAASYASLVNVSESGSSRNMGDLHKNALAMAKYYKGLADEEETETPVDVTRFARTRAIVREG